MPDFLRIAIIINNSTQNWDKMASSPQIDDIFLNTRRIHASFVQQLRYLPSRRRYANIIPTRPSDKWPCKIRAVAQLGRAPGSGRCPANNLKLSPIALKSFFMGKARLLPDPTCCSKALKNCRRWIKLVDKQKHNAVNLAVESE